MGKVAQNSAKYVIEAEMKSTGTVEKPDIVGAIFGQTEGLLDADLDLRELQERGRIGRIEVEVETSKGRSTATITIPSSLDATSTSILAASLETIDRVGPTNANVEIRGIKDQRVSKRDYIVKRAKQLLSDIEDERPEKNRITAEIKHEVRTRQITQMDGFDAGPGAESSEEIILVEGRADLLNLLKHGVKNVVALGGTSVPDKLIDLVEDRSITVFLDGDRGGDLILKELRQRLRIDSVARAPDNKEVEELGKEQVFEALRDSQPTEYTDETDEEAEEISDETREAFRQTLEELVGTRAAHLLDEEHSVIQKMPADSFEPQECHAAVVDGTVNREMVEKLEGRAQYLVGMERDGYANSSSLKILTRNEL
jgi:DNA primase